MTFSPGYFLRETVEKHKLIYMLCETGYYQPEVMAAREMYKRGEFGELLFHVDNGRGSEAGG